MTMEDKEPLKDASTNRLHVTTTKGSPNLKQPEPVVMIRPPPSPPGSSNGVNGNTTKDSNGASNNPVQEINMYGNECPPDKEETAVAVAAALVGENVCDSPTKAREVITVPQSTTPTRTRTNSQDDGVRRNAFSKDQVKRAMSTEEDEYLSVGMLAAGLAWVQRQKERRRRSYLQNQAERQLRKIADAERPVNKKGGLAENPTFMQLASSAVGTNSASYDDSENGSGRVKIKQGPQLSKSGEGLSGHFDISAMEDEDFFLVPKVRIEKEVGNVPAPILNEDQMQQVANHVIPKTIAYCRWKRLYGLGRDGDSFHACIRSIRNEPRTLLVVRTTRGAILGGYADSPWNTTEHGSAQFYGSAQACLFSVIPETNKLKVFRWSGANRYIQLCDIHHKMLAFGGGGDDGAFGLCVEEDFQVGSTGPCDTFQNEPLCDQENFEIVDLEVWGFLTGQF